MSASTQLCGGKLDLKTYLFLNKLCEDCFSLFRDTDVYDACRYELKITIFKVKTLIFVNFCPHPFRIILREGIKHVTLHK